MESREQPHTVFNRDFLIFQFIVFLVNVSFSMVMPVMSGAATALGASGAAAGLVAGIFAIASMLSRPFTNPLVDVLNKRRQYRFGIFLYIVSYTGFGLVKSVGLLLVLRCVQGIGMGIMGPVGAALTGFYVPARKVSTGVGIYLIMSLVSMTVGPVLSGLIVRELGYSRCFIAAAAFSVLAMLLTLVIRDVGGKKGDKRISDLFMKPRFGNFFCLDCLAPAGIIFLFCMAYGCLYSFLVQAAAEHGVENISVFFTVYALTTICMRPVMEILGRRVGQSNLIIPCGASLALCLVLCACSRSLALYLAAAVLMGIGYGSFSVIMLIICNERVSPEKRGLASGTYYLSLDMGTAIGPVIGGAVASASGYGRLMLLLTVPVLLALLIRIFAKKGIDPLPANEN